MARMYYQYETSPRKYEPEYTPKKKPNKKIEETKISKKDIEKKRLEKARKQKIEEKKNKTKQVATVVVIFVMLLSISYRQISIMEMFNQKKELENNLAVIEKENGQVEKSIKEVESTLDWNKIKQTATEQLGMQSKEAIPLDLEKMDHVETQTTYIKEEKTNLFEKIVGFIINR